MPHEFPPDVVHAMRIGQDWTDNDPFDYGITHDDCCPPAWALLLALLLSVLIGCAAVYVGYQVYRHPALLMLPFAACMARLFYLAFKDKA